MCLFGCRRQPCRRITGSSAHLPGAPVRCPDEAATLITAAEKRLLEPGRRLSDSRWILNASVRRFGRASGVSSQVRWCFL